MIKPTIPDVYSELINSPIYKHIKTYYGGRGGGKSWAFAFSILAICSTKTTRVLCTREVQKSIKASVHRLLSDIIKAIPAFSEFFTIQEKQITGLNGSMIFFEGLRLNEDGIKSYEGCDICWVEEAQAVSDRSWESLLPTIRKTGSEIWISFNPKNASDPTWRRFVNNPRDDSISRKVSWRDNPYFNEVLNNERLALKAEDLQAYLHVWEGELDVRQTGAIYAKAIVKAREEGRICRVPYDPSVEVYTSWDLGFGDATAIWWFQYVGREIRWLEYYENNGEQLEHYIKLVKSKQYNYGMHYLPFDGGHGNIRGLSVSKQLRSMGLQNTVLNKSSNIKPEIENVNQCLTFSVFDRDKTNEGVHALENYSYKWLEDRGTLSDKPFHDWSSNGADSMRYACIAMNRVKNRISRGTNNKVSMKLEKRVGTFMNY